MELQLETASKPAPAICADRMGIWASALCLVPFLLTPIRLAMSAVFAHFLPSEERTHRSLAVFIAFVGAIALIRGFRAHRSIRVICPMVAGLTCIFFAA